MGRLLEAARAHGRCALVVVAVGALAFVGGRWMAPVRVEERERVEYRDRIEYRDREVVRRVEGPVRIRTVTRELPAPPGSPCPDRPLVETVREEVREPVTTERQAERQAEAQAAEVRTVERIVTVRPDWRAGVLVGADLGALSLAQPLQVLAAGAHVERRILGPLSLGAFALVPVARPLAPAVGLSLSGEW